VKKMMSDPERSGISRWKRLSVVLKNAFSSQLNERVVGFQFAGDPFLIERDDALAYALAVDDPNPAYSDEQDAITTPLFASRILMKPMEAVLLHDQLGLNLLRMVHAEQSLRFLRPLRVGATVVARTWVSAIRQVSSGQILEVGVAIVEDEETLVEGKSAMFLRQKQKGRKSSRKQAPADHPALKSLVKFAIASDQPKRYAAASHDYNPIHTSALAAKLAGLKAPIAHGLCVMAVTGVRLVDHFAQSDPTRLETLSVRFSKPTYPGRELDLRVAAEDNKVSFALEYPDGKPVLSMGKATFR